MLTGSTGPVCRCSNKDCVGKDSDDDEEACHEEEEEEKGEEKEEEKGRPDNDEEEGSVGATAEVTSGFEIGSCTA